MRPWPETIAGSIRRRVARGTAGAALVVAACLLAVIPALAEPASSAGFRYGQPATPQELSPFFAYPPDGAGLPDGKGSVADGKAVFAGKCAMCHGDKLQGIKATGAPALVGGRGSLRLVPPKKTVESYLPYATTLFDYIKRAMPFNAPGSLTNDEIYALCAYILAQGHVVSDQTVLDKASLPKVEMPNRNGFTPYRGPSPLFFP